MEIENTSQLEPKGFPLTLLSHQNSIAYVSVKKKSYVHLRPLDRRENFGIGPNIKILWEKIQFRKYFFVSM